MDENRIVIPVTYEVVEKGGKRKKGEAKQGDGTTSGESNFISTMGVQKARLHQKVKRRRVKLPQGGDAPFQDEYDRATAPEFGGKTSRYERPTGFTQNKINKAGYKGDDQYSKSSFPTAQSFKQRMAQIEKDIRANKLRDRELQSSIKSKIEKIDKVQQSTDVLTARPDDFIGKTMLRSLGKAGPYGAAVVAAITSIVSAPETVQQIVQAMGVKGGPLNSDWHLFFEDTAQGFFSLEDKKNRIIGTDSFIVEQGSGYRPIEGTDIYVSLLDRDEDRLARIGQDAKAKGVS